LIVNTIIYNLDWSITTRKIGKSGTNQQCDGKSRTPLYKSGVWITGANREINARGTIRQYDSQNCYGLVDCIKAHTHTHVAAAYAHWAKLIHM